MGAAVHLLGPLVEHLLVGAATVQLARDVLDQGSTRGDVERLHAHANGEHGVVGPAPEQRHGAVVRARPTR